MRRGRFTHVEADGCDISEIKIVLKPVPLLSLENDFWLYYGGK